MRIGNSGKSAPLILAALLLAGCAASTAASTPESAATPSPSAAPPATAETAQTTLTYDEIRPIADLGTEPGGLCTGYFTVSRDGLWGLIRADGEEVLPCEAPVPITRCGGGWHWIYWPEGLGWSDSSTMNFDELNAAVQAGNNGSLCPGHGGSADTFFFDLDVGAAVCYYHGTPGYIKPISDADWTEYGEPLPVYPAYEAGEEGDPACPGTAQGGYFYVRRTGENVYPQKDGVQVEAILASYFFDEVLAPVQLETGWAYLDRDGNILTEAVYEPTYTDSIRDATPTLAAPLQNGYAAVSRDDLWGLLNANGAEALPCAYEGVAWEGTTLWVQEDGVWCEQELPDGAAAEAVTIDRDYEVTLDDGAPLPTAALPLYYKGNYAGLTWAELAEQTGFAEAELRALNPDAAQNPDGTLAGTGELLLAESYPVPQEAQILVTFSAPGVPYPYSSRDFRVPAALEQEAAVALAKAYYETWAEGRGLAVQESNVDSYRTVTGGRFADFAAVQEYYSTIWAGEALEVLLEPYPWRGAAPTAYFAEGPDGELLTQGYAYDSVIPQAGYTHTAPQTAPDGSVTFAGICIQTTDDTGAPLPAEAGRLLYTPIRLEETEEGWRVTSVGAPF